MRRKRMAGLTRFVTFISAVIWSAGDFKPAFAQNLPSTDACRSSGSGLGSGAVQAVAISPDGKLLGVLDDGLFTIWDLNKRIRLSGYSRRSTCNAPDGGQPAIAFSKESHQVEILEGAALEFYDLTNNQLGPRVIDIAGLAPMRGLNVATQRIATNNAGDILIIDSSTGRLTQKLHTDAGAAAEVTWSDDGKFIAVSNAFMFSLGSNSPNQYGNVDGIITILEAGTHVETRLESSSAHFFAVAFSRDDRLVAAVAYDGSPGNPKDLILNVWKRDGGQALLTTPLAHPANYIGFCDGDHLAITGRDGVSLATISNGLILNQIFDWQQFAPSFASAISADGKVLAVGGQGDRVELRSLPSLSLIGELQ